MVVNEILILIGAIVVAAIVFKLILKISFKIILIIVLLVVAGYFLLFFNGGLFDLGNKKFILIELQEKYCSEGKEEVKCTCIINPLMEDINSNYTDVELAELQKDKLKSLQVIYTSLKENKPGITQCLKENDAEDLWDDFIKDLTRFDLKSKLDDLIPRSEEKD